MEEFSFELGPGGQDGDGGAIQSNNKQRMRRRFVAGEADEFILSVKYTWDIKMKGSRGHEGPARCMHIRTHILNNWAFSLRKRIQN